MLRHMIVKRYLSFQNYKLRVMGMGKRNFHAKVLHLLSSFFAPRSSVSKLVGDVPSIESLAACKNRE